MLDDLLQILLYLYVFLLPFLPLNVKGTTIPVSGDLMLAAIFGIFGLSLLRQTSRQRLVMAWRSARPGLLELFMLLMSVVMFGSIPYALEKTLALSESLRFLSYVFLFFIVKYSFDYFSFIRRLLGFYLLNAGVLSVIGIYQYLFKPDYILQWVSADASMVRVPAAFGNPNSFGAYLILVIFPVLVLTFTQRRHLTGLVYGLFSLVLVLNIVFTGSRNALLGLILGGLVLVISYNWRFIIALVFLAPAALFLPQLSTRLHDLGNISQNLSRIKLWQTALKMIKDHPLLGVGNGNFVSYYDQYIAKYPELAWEDWKRYPVHNSYLKVQSELGVAGSISLAGILISAWLRVRKAAHQVSDSYTKSMLTGFLASIPAFYLMNFSDNLLFVPKVTTYFWLMLAIAASAEIQSSNELG